MKCVRLLTLVCAIFMAANVAMGQTAPNCENGWKPFGSYDGSHLDTVNLMNGNLMLHAPVVPDVAQRGAVSLSHTLYASSKDWQVVCRTGTNGNEICDWEKGGGGASIIRTPGLS